MDSDCVTCGGSGLVASGSWNGDPQREPETVDCPECSAVVKGWDGLPREGRHGPIVLALIACERCGHRFPERPGRSGKWARLCDGCLCDEAF